MASIGRLQFVTRIINSSCAWASEEHQLQELYANKFTGGVTTRTATLKGFDEDSRIHTVNFSGESVSSVNSYGYSPHPLSSYINWVENILRKGEPKPVILSITSSYPAELSDMVDAIQAMRKRLGDSEGSVSRVAIELNTSCPNIENKPPPAYTPDLLKPLLDVLASHFWADQTLAIGLKLPPYVYSTQFQDMTRTISSLTRNDTGQGVNPITFLTCTNTLGTSLLFSEQATLPSDSTFALPTPLGGLAGEPIHALSLGNVYSFAKLLQNSDDPALHNISVIGVGGVSTPAAVQRMITAGATIVACATALGRKGVAVFSELA